MENATKALIIAGAILVAILLVTMGISLLSNTGALQDQQSQQQNELNVKSFNGQLEGAIGQSVTGDKVLDLIEKVDLKKIDDPDLNLTIKYEGELTSNKIRKTSRYKVEVTQKDSGGYITEITVSNKS